MKVQTPSAALAFIKANGSTIVGLGQDIESPELEAAGVAASHLTFEA